MFAGGEGDRSCGRQLQRKDMLDVVAHSRRVAVAPFGKDLVAVAELPVAQGCERRVDAGFLGNFAGSSGQQWLIRFLAAGDRLPVTGVRRALKQQHLQVGGVNHHQNRYRSLVRPHVESGSVVERTYAS
jgi:hypothetical protein